MYLIYNDNSLQFRLQNTWRCLYVGSVYIIIPAHCGALVYNIGVNFWHTLACFLGDIENVCLGLCLLYYLLIILLRAW